MPLRECIFKYSYTQIRVLLLFHIAFLNSEISVTLQDAVASLHNIHDECTPGIPRALCNLRLPMYMDIPHMPEATLATDHGRQENNIQ